MHGARDGCCVVVGNSYTLTMYQHIYPYYEELIAAFEIQLICSDCREWHGIQSGSHGIYLFGRAGFDKHYAVDRRRTMNTTAEGRANLDVFMDKLKQDGNARIIQVSAV